MTIGTVPDEAFGCKMSMSFVFPAVVCITVMVSCSIPDFGVADLIFDRAFRIA